MLFRLINIPVIFQVFINKILKEFLNQFMVIYLNNIIVYLKIFEEYIVYIDKMLEAINKVNLWIKLSKTKFYTQKIKFFRFIIMLNKI